MNKAVIPLGYNKQPRGTDKGERSSCLWFHRERNGLRLIDLHKTHDACMNTSQVFNTDVQIVLVSCSVKQQPYNHIRSGTIDDLIDEVILDRIAKLVKQ